MYERTYGGFRCGGLDKGYPEFICPSHAEGQRTDDTGTMTEALDILSERSESPRSTDSDDDHIVEAAIR